MTAANEIIIGASRLVVRISDPFTLRFKTKDRLPDLSVRERTEAPSELISMPAESISCLAHRPLLLSPGLYAMESTLFNIVLLSERDIRSHKHRRPKINPEENNEV